MWKLLFLFFTAIIFDNQDAELMLNNLFIICLKCVFLCYVFFHNGKLYSNKNITHYTIMCFALYQIKKEHKRK